MSAMLDILYWDNYPDADRITGHLDRINASFQMDPSLRRDDYVAFWISIIPRKSARNPNPGYGLSSLTYNIECNGQSFVIENDAQTEIAEEYADFVLSGLEFSTTYAIHLAHDAFPWSFGAESKYKRTDTFDVFAINIYPPAFTDQ